MSNKVNLDALIPREDFEIIPDEEDSQSIQTVSIRDLEKECFFYSSIRKPDFQRETNEWEIEKIADFVNSFLVGDLIPAIILWRGGSRIFVIDGSHRLSSLIAWVQDDYGDALASRLFYDTNLPEEQITVADKTRKLIKKRFGSYQDHKDANQHPEKFPTDIVARARKLASLAIQLQWVKGDASKAEASFFKINQQAAPINKTELRLLQSRNKPIALAARAVIRAGTGYKYWSRFNVEKKLEIEKEAKIINELLFAPELRTPIKTLDLPVAGRGYSSQTLPLVYDLIEISNSDIKIKEDDVNGINTIKHLINCRKIMNRITGTHVSSLGLHPIVYFYSNNGRYNPTSFFGVIELIKELEKTNRYIEFIMVRRSFEDFILLNKSFQNQIIWKYGSGIKGYLPMKDYYYLIFNSFDAGADQKEVLEKVLKEFDYLQHQEDGFSNIARDTFDTLTKSEAFIREALRNPLRCAICNSMIHFNSISIDHIKRREDGGLGTVDNAQLTHPFCNSTVKN